MPTKSLNSQTDAKGFQDIFKFGGGSNEIFAYDDGPSAYGYIIRGGGGDDQITGSDFKGRPGGTGTMIDPRTDAGDVLIGGHGNDQIVGGLGNDTIYGGDEDGSDSAKGKGALPTNGLYGDARFLDLNGGSYTGGDDVLIGGNDGFNNMVGDVASASNGTFTGGADRLVSGTNSNDTMYGDFASGYNATWIGGADIFVFAANNGFDQIGDFEAGKDKVELTGFANLNDFADLAGMWTTSFGLGTVLALDLDGTVDGMGDVIAFSGFGEGQQDLLSGDFIFT